MSVRLTIWAFPNPADPSGNSYMHPVWNPLMTHMTREPDYPEWDSFRRRDYVNHMLSSYNGGIVQFNRLKVMLEFETQEDLTQFVLAWS
jgi:hypothetical protein